MKRALVLLSGGQDSTTVLFQALKHNDYVHCLTINYNQRHKIELESAWKISEIAGNLEHDQLDVGPILIGSSPLVNTDEEVEQYENVVSLPGGLEKTFVPGRNALFLILAANRAYKHQCNLIYIGVSQEDYGGYPDCRRAFINKMQDTIRSGFRYDENDPFNPTLMTPLIAKNKKETVILAKTLGEKCWEALAYSHTCYNGQCPPCGHCHACLLRAKGFEEAGEVDPLIARVTS